MAILHKNYPPGIFLSDLVVCRGHLPNINNPRFSKPAMPTADPGKRWTNAIIRVADAPNLHALLEETLGKPATCFENGSVKNPSTGECWTSSLWTIESPITASAELSEHIGWAGELIARHGDYFRKLIQAGADVSVHLSYDSDSCFVLFTLHPEHLLPFANLGIPLEIYAAISET